MRLLTPNNFIFHDVQFSSWPGRRLNKRHLLVILEPPKTETKSSQTLGILLQYNAITFDMIPSMPAFTFLGTVRAARFFRRMNIAHTRHLNKRENNPKVHASTLQMQNM
jgi:hypothetical protein